MIFLIIPLSRIIPRILAKRRNKGSSSQTIQDERFQSDSNEYAEKPLIPSSKPQTKNMIVLGELNKGSKTFESIQKNTGFENKELDTILQDLEKNGLISVHKKQGLLGSKIEIYPTDKGFKEYYS